MTKIYSALEVGKEFGDVVKLEFVLDDNLDIFFRVESSWDEYHYEIRHFYIKLYEWKGPCPRAGSLRK